MIDKSKLPPKLRSFPTPFVRLLTQNYYEPGDSDYTVTSLIGPPRRSMFKAQGHQEAQRSIYAGMVAMWGTAMHWQLQQGAREEEGEFTEVRNFVTMNIDGDDVKVSGCMDLWEANRVWDYKFIKGDQLVMKTDHHDQLQYNAWLAEQNGWKVEGIGVCYTDKTWSPGQADINPNYPQDPCKVFLEDYRREWAEKNLRERVTDHHQAAKGNPRDCTKKEKWETPTLYAILKNGGKRAINGGIYEDRAEAETNIKPGHFIQERPGIAKYCSWCGYSHLCEQFKREEHKRLESKNEP